VLVLGAVVVIAGIGAWLRSGSRTDNASIAGAAQVAAEESSPPHESLDGPESDAGALDSTASRGPVAEARVPGAEAPRDPEPVADRTVRGSPGRLRVRAIDAETRSPVPRIRVRAMSETRLADRSSVRDGEAVELSLSPDTYAVLVMAKGYEASELPAQSIEAGKTTILDAVELHPGSARILGTVTGDSWTPDTLWVELVGEGRCPCPACVEGPSSENRKPAQHGQRWSKEDFCSRCGFGKSSSRLPVPPDGRFLFDRLTSGSYAVRLMDVEERTLCDPKSVDLDIGKSLPIEIRFGAPRRVRVEIVDTDGASLAPEWAARLRKQAADDETEALREVVERAVQPPEFDCQFRTEHLRVGSSTFTPPTLDATGIFISGVGAFGARKLGTASRGGRDDRPREKKDALRPEITPAKVSTGYYPSAVDPDGTVRFESVPSLELSLRMTCGGFTATVEIPSSRDEVRLQALLRASGEQGTSTAEPSADPRTYREYEAGRMH